MGVSGATTLGEVMLKKQCVVHRGKVPEIWYAFGEERKALHVLNDMGIIKIVEYGTDAPYGVLELYDEVGLLPQ